MRLGKQNASTQGDIQMSPCVFLLKRIGSSSNAPFVHVDFSPQSTPNPNQHSPINHQSPSRNYPIFNRDALHFTPAFLLQEDKNKIQKNLQSYLNLHEERAKEAKEQKQQIYVPKPSKANSFCSICRTSIDDYLTHLNMPAHQSLLRASQFCKDIVQMCNLFAEKKKKPIKKNKCKAKTSRKCRAVKEEISQANYTTTSAMSIEQYNLQKIIQEVC